MDADEWFLVNSGPGESALNMGLDEALLEAMPRLQRPVLRFYGWEEAAATFGYFQRYGEVERLTPLRPLIRRPTGGGIVPHERDWTYSVAFPTRHEWYSTTAVESYRRIHDWIRVALARLGLDAQLAPKAIKAQPGQCFEGYDRFDILWRSRKIAGAAQRRRRDGLLIQGSLQPVGTALTRAEWEDTMRRVGEVERNIAWELMPTDAALATRARDLARLKYSQASYNAKR